MAKTNYHYSGLYVYKRLLGYAKRYWQGIALGITGTAVMASIDASLTGMIKPLLDRGFIARDLQFIHWLPLAIILAFLVRGAANFMSNYNMAWTGRNVVMTFRQEIFAHLMQLPARFYDNTASGQLLSTMIYNVDQVAKASTDAVVTVVQETCFIAGLIVVMVMTSWQLSLVFFFTAPIVATIARHSSKRMRKLSTNVQQSMGDITHIAQEAIEGYRVIRTFGGESYEIEKFNNSARKNRTRELKINATSALASSGVQFIAGSIVAIMIFFATKNVFHVTAGGFTAMVAAMLAMLKPMRNLTNVNNSIQKGIAGAESIFLLLDRNPEADLGTKKLIRAQGAISFTNVSFAYQADKPVLHNLNFQIEPGQTIALVGRSGSGKSSLVSLLPRFYDEYSGIIAIDKINTRELCLTDLRNQFAFVSQNVTLFNDTIAHNIAYGRLSDASQAEIMAAAKAAHALEFIETFPDGFNTLIGGNGILLSGGQRQRIAIARALLKNAPILILDEATSALDTEAERYIQAALEELMHNRTTLIIAHRLSTIEKADKIIVLENGRILEMGSHSELFANDSYYAKLYRMQFTETQILEAVS